MENKTLTRYLGYEGVNLDNFNVTQLSNIRSFVKMYLDRNRYYGVQDRIDSRPYMSLEEAKSLAEEFYKKHISLHPILVIDDKDVSRLKDELRFTTSGAEFYDRVNQVLKSVDQKDLKIVQDDIDHFKDNRLVKKLLICPGEELNEDRKIYFSEIIVSNKNSDILAQTLVHEWAHAQVESNIGYTKDYLNREIIPILMELIYTYENNPEAYDLLLTIRGLDVLDKYRSILNNSIDVKDWMYLKSTLYALKLFDLYVRENKQKNKDKFMYEVEDIMNGKEQLEDLLAHKSVTPAKAADLSLLKRYF